MSKFDEWWSVYRQRISTAGDLEKGAAQDAWDTVLDSLTVSIQLARSYRGTVSYEVACDKLQELIDKLKPSKEQDASNISKHENRPPDETDTKRRATNRGSESLSEA